MTIALARRYRPKRFSELLVQEHVASVLRGAVLNGRVGHGYLLTGPRGVGKTTAARILAMALNCERSPEDRAEGEPCGECASCQRVWSGSANLDVVEIDAASNRGVDDARELRERAMYAASKEGHHKVYIVDEAHMLTREAWNALLKVLEEPPPGVVFVFATTEPHKIAQTAAPVMSRLQRFDFRRIGPAAIQQRLSQVLAAEGIGAEQDALVLLARHADGGMRDALSMLDQCLSFGEGAVTAERVREILGLVDEEIFGEVLRVVAERDSAAVFPLVQGIVDRGADLTEFVSGAAEALRATLMSQIGVEPEGLTEGLKATITSYSGSLAAGDLLRMLNLLTEAEAAIRRGGSPRLLVETLLLRWTMIDRVVDLREVLAGAASGGKQSSAAAPATRSRRRPDAAGPPGESRSSDGADQAPAPAAEVAPIAFTADSIRSHWEDFVIAGKEISNFLGAALDHVTLTEVDPPRLAVRLDDPNPMFAEALNRHGAELCRIVEQRVGSPVRLEVLSDEIEAEAAGPGKPQRYSQERVKAERLQAHRSKDPALDAAVDELDLEIQE